MEERERVSKQRQDRAANAQTISVPFGAVCVYKPTHAHTDTHGHLLLFTVICLAGFLFIFGLICCHCWLSLLLRCLVQFMLHLLATSQNEIFKCALAACPIYPNAPHGSPASPCDFHSHLQQLSASALGTDRVIAKITTSTASCCCCSCIPIECMRIAMIFALSSSLTSPRLAPSRLFSSHLISRQPLCVCGFPGRVRQSLPMLIPIDSCFVASPHSVCVCASFASLTLQCLIWFAPVWFLVPGIQLRLISSLPATTYAYARACCIPVGVTWQPAVNGTQRHIINAAFIWLYTNKQQRASRH